jgi:hypothetical protein
MPSQLPCESGVEVSTSQSFEAARPFDLSAFFGRRDPQAVGPGLATNCRQRIRLVGRGVVVLSIFAVPTVVPSCSKKVPFLVPSYSPLSVNFCTDLHSSGRKTQDSASAETRGNPRERRAKAACFLGKTGRFDSGSRGGTRTRTRVAPLRILSIARKSREPAENVRRSEGIRVFSGHVSDSFRIDQ